MIRFKSGRDRKVEIVVDLPFERGFIESVVPTFREQSPSIHVKISRVFGKEKCVTPFCTRLIVTKLNVTRGRLFAAFC